MASDPSWLNSAPADPVPVPPPIRHLVGADRAMAAWTNQLGGITWPIDHDAGPCFLKWAPAGSGIDLAGEAERTTWASRHTAVPEVVAFERTGEGDVLVTRALPGTSAVAPRWKADPGPAVDAIGRGLRTMHGELPADACPYRADVVDRRRRADEELRRHRGCRSRPTRLPPDVDGLDLDDLAALLADPPITEATDVVVAHGDACAPNTIVDEAGTWVGHVDLGDLGVDDRWADLAIVTWSLEWNYGSGWEARFFDAYGIDPDPERIRFHRVVWALT